MTEEKNRLYVGNLPYKKADESAFETADLAKVFADAGFEPSETIVISDKFTGRSKGFGFVTLADDETAEKAMNATNGQEVEGRQLRVSIARPPKQRTE